MAIKKIINADGQSEDVKITLELDNGDLEALSTIVDQYSFKDFQAALRFALVVLLKASGDVVYVKEGDNKVALTPSDSLLKPRDSHVENVD